VQQQVTTNFPKKISNGCSPASYSSGSVKIFYFLIAVQKKYVKTVSSAGQKIRMLFKILYFFPQKVNFAVIKAYKSLIMIRHHYLLTIP